MNIAFTVATSAKLITLILPCIHNFANAAFPEIVDFFLNLSFCNRTGHCNNKFMYQLELSRS